MSPPVKNQSLPLSLYVHIPFCRSKCTYCDFCSFPLGQDVMERYCDALIEEIFEEGHHFKSHLIDTVFIGGGTPTQLPSPLLQRILKALKENFTILPEAEYTCEANPGTITKEHLRLFKDYGINRLSLGAQAYQPQLLKTLGRIHTWDEVTQSVYAAYESGLNNISIDLMFGLPGQSLAHWKATLNAALQLPVKHLSCYGLIVEEGTQIQKQLEQKHIFLPKEATEREMYDYTFCALTDRGFLQYEISNFARAGYECKHNLGYWSNHFYLGLGLAAHSMLPPSEDGVAYARRANTGDLEEYMGYYTAPGQKRVPSFSIRENSSITKAEALFETVMTGLRLTKGLDDDQFLILHGKRLEQAFPNVIPPLIDQGLLYWNQNHLALTRKGMDLQNRVLVAFLP